MEAFLNNLLMVLPAIRIDFFLQKRRPAVASIKATASALTGAADAIFELKTPKHGLEATALLQNGEFVVQTGSKARLTWQGSNHNAYKRLYDELITSGVLGSGLIDQSQKMTAAARQIADMKVWAQRS